jgi:hypothetical protein
MLLDKKIFISTVPVIILFTNHSGMTKNVLKH